VSATQDELFSWMATAGREAYAPTITPLGPEKGSYSNNTALCADEEKQCSSFLDAPEQTAESACF